MVEHMTQEAPAVLAIEAVHKIFLASDQPVHALADTSFEVQKGQFVCLLGPSGCGKSTLLRIIAGLESASAGRVITRLHEGSSDPAVVFQDGGLFAWRTVEENISFGLQMQGVGRRERKAIAHDWINRVGLRGFEKAYPSQLSGGMRQRVALARGFASGNEILLMDEPFGALDAQTRAFMQEELLALWQEHQKTVLFVTHSIEEALLLGDRVAVMTGGPGRVNRWSEVPFERPRTPAIASSQEFVEMRDALWAQLRDEVVSSMQASA